MQLKRNHRLGTDWWWMRTTQSSGTRPVHQTEAPKWEFKSHGKAIATRVHRPAPFTPRRQDHGETGRARAGTRLVAPTVGENPQSLTQLQCSREPTRLQQHNHMKSRFLLHRSGLDVTSYDKAVPSGLRPVPRVCFEHRLLLRLRPSVSSAALRHLACFDCHGLSGRSCGLLCRHPRASLRPRAEVARR